MTTTESRRSKQNPDEIAGDHPAYWAARLIIAIRDNDKKSITTASQKLATIGIMFVKIPSVGETNR